jgi:hypothetical protein
MYQIRVQAEVEATMSLAPHNRLLSATLSRLLEERKKAASPKEIERIANKYDMDIKKLESLARFVNSPTIDEGTTVRTRGPNGDETITSTASLVIDLD